MSRVPKMELTEFNNANQTVSQMNIDPTHLYRNHQLQQQGLRYVNPTGVANNPQMGKQIVSKHRELPVDVPDSFVGIAKQSPRYPPPKPHRHVSPINANKNNNNYNNANNIQAANLPSSHQHHQQHNDYNNHHQQQQQQNNNATAQNNLNHNSGLRSSIKLQQLEKARNNGQNMQPAINQAFELDEEYPAIQQTTFATTNDQAYNNNNNKSHQQQHQQQTDLSLIYNRLQTNLAKEFSDLSGDAKLDKLLSIYNTIIQTHNKQFKIPNLTSRYNLQGQEPITYKVSDLLQSVIQLLNDGEINSDSAELLSILCKHEMEGVCSAFDRITQSFEFAKFSTSGSSSPQSSDLNNSHLTGNQNGQQQQQQPQHVPMYTSPHGNQRPLNNQMNSMHYQVQMDIENNIYPNNYLHPLTDIDHGDGTCTKIVCIEKSTQQPLGATIKNIDGSVIIGRIVSGGAAYNSGLLNEGDEIIEVNEIPMRGKSVNDVVNEIDALKGTLKFKIITRYYNKPQRNPQDNIIVKAFFSYDGENDNFMPCKDLALYFEKGEILTIIDRSDPQWWQARRESVRETDLAGLIPSINFLKQKEKISNHEDYEANYFKHYEKKTFVSKLFNCPKGTSPRRRKKLNIPFGLEEIPYYEEVSVYYPNTYRKRPILLVGPKSIGQQEIQLKLIQDTNRFARAISYTTKPIQEHERNGVDFHFVSRAQFESFIKADKFLEYGQYQNQYYGFSLEAMMEVVRSKKTCIQIVNINSLFNIRQGRAGSELKPYFVFVKPDDSHPEKLRNLVTQFSQQKSNIEEQIKSAIAEVDLIESHYLPFFDLVLTVSDIDLACQELLLAIEKIENEAQWIPSFWQDKPTS